MEVFTRKTLSSTEELDGVLKSLERTIRMFMGKTINIPIFTISVPAFFPGERGCINARFESGFEVRLVQFGFDTEYHEEFWSYYTDKFQYDDGSVSSRIGICLGDRCVLSDDLFKLIASFFRGDLTVEQMDLKLNSLSELQ